MTATTATGSQMDPGLAACLAAAATAQPTWLDALAFAGILLAAIPSAAGNAFVIAVILRTRELRREAAYIIIVVLALVDLVHSYVAIYPFGGAILLQRSLPSCENRLPNLNAVYPAWYATCISYTTVAVNRYMAICAPHWNKKIFSRRNMTIWGCLLPFTTFIIFSPALSGKCCIVDFAPDLYLMRYEVGREHELNVQLMICWFFSAQATVISCVLYPIAFWRVKDLRSKITTANNAAAKQEGPPGAGLGGQGLKNSDVKLLIQFSALTGVYTFTWIVLHYEASRGADASKILGYLGIFGYAAMTGMNPLIYFSLNKTLRKAVGDTMRDFRAGFAVCCGGRAAGGTGDLRNDGTSSGVHQSVTATSNVGARSHQHHS